MRVVAVLLALFVMEGVAHVVEFLWAPAERIYPLPAPNADQKASQALDGAIAAGGLRQSLQMIEDEQRGWKLQPSTVLCTARDVQVRINGMGLRGPEIGPHRPGEIRIMTVGDSSIFGYGVPEAAVFSEVAAEELRGQWSPPVAAVNGAIPGYDTEQSLKSLRTYGATIAPAWVVIGNIWSDLYRPDPRAWLTGEARKQGHKLQWLATYRVMARLLAPLTRPTKVRWIASREDIGPSDGSGRVELARYAQNLEDMATYTESLGARPAFLMLPAPLDFDPAPVPEQVLEFRDAMRQVAHRHDAPLVDGPAVFRDREAGVSEFMDQVHPAVSGHALLGQALAEALAAVGPPPDGAHRYDEPDGPLVPMLQPVPGPLPSLRQLKNCGSPQ